jgi:hypothetical protein
MENVWIAFTVDRNGCVARSAGSQGFDDLPASVDPPGVHQGAIDPVAHMWLTSIVDNDGWVARVS